MNNVFIGNFKNEKKNNCLFLSPTFYTLYSLSFVDLTALTAAKAIVKTFSKEVVCSEALVCYNSD